MVNVSIMASKEIPYILRTRTHVSTIVPTAQRVPQAEPNGSGIARSLQGEHATSMQNVQSREGAMHGQR